MICCWYFYYPEVRYLFFWLFVTFLWSLTRHMLCQTWLCHTKSGRPTKNVKIKCNEPWLVGQVSCRDDWPITHSDTPVLVEHQDPTDGVFCDHGADLSQSLNRYLSISLQLEELKSTGIVCQIRNYNTTWSWLPLSASRIAMSLLTHHNQFQRSPWTFLCSVKQSQQLLVSAFNSELVLLKYKMLGMLTSDRRYICEI